MEIEDSLKYQKYQHVERFGMDETRGIEIGECFVFPKIDGTNGKIWFDGGIRCGGRNRELSIDNDNRGFVRWVLDQNKFLDFFNENPDAVLFGEWLVPHTLKTYRDNAWNKFYVFDVIVLGEYLPYETYKIQLEKHGIEYIPAICKIKDPTYDRILTMLELNNYLIKDGCGVGEGIVVKNYNYKNRYGRSIWAKVVRNEFKEKHSLSETREIKEKKLIEQGIVDKFVTKSFVDKEFSKIEGFSSRDIPRLLNTVFYCLIKEESWNFVKEFNRPTINYKTLYSFCVSKTKLHLPNIFS